MVPDWQVVSPSGAAKKTGYRARVAADASLYQQAVAGMNGMAATDATAHTSAA